MADHLFMTYSQYMSVSRLAMLQWMTAIHLKQSTTCATTKDLAQQLAAYNKTVFLRERKRHTTHHVASTHYPVLAYGLPQSCPGQGVPQE